MLASHLHEWVHLLLRWIHFIVGVAWIGASFYFNWLENHLNRHPPQPPGVAGQLWAIHGGGFYHIQKYGTPDALPPVLHWFKWEAYTTWLSGMTLLIVIYYFNSALLLAPTPTLAPPLAITLSLATLGGSWLIYHELCCSPLARHPLALGLVLAAYFGGLAWLLGCVFSGRAMYMHIGAALGTIMVGNVFFIIIPSQKQRVAALTQAVPTGDNTSVHSDRSLQRSRHNNYFTLPVLFIMISSHFPSTYGARQPWLILLALSGIGIMVRYYFNARVNVHKARAVVKSLWWMLPLAFLLMASVMWLSAPPRPSPTATVTAAEITTIIHQRCYGCHATTPTIAGFAGPPAGLVLEQWSQLEANAARIYQAVATEIMPPGNLTQMTPAERQQIANWYGARGGLPSPSPTP